MSFATNRRGFIFKRNIQEIWPLEKIFLRNFKGTMQRAWSWRFNISSFSFFIGLFYVAREFIVV
jgi:hypothetical protein